MGFNPRIALESYDSSEIRLSKIQKLIKQSQYSIHDLSRCQATKKGEHFRLNMPFELGVDYGCKKFHGKRRGTKKILVLEEKPFRYQAAISDLSGCDIVNHNGQFDKAVRSVRNWLVNEAGGARIAPTKILNSWDDFQEWHYEKLESEGYSEEDILDTPTKELMGAMTEWIALGKPV